MTVGPVLVGAGLALFTLIGPSGDYLTEVLPAVVVFGFGLAVTVAPLTSTVLDAAPAERAGIASAVNNDVARAAGGVLAFFTVRNPARAPGAAQPGARPAPALPLSGLHCALDAPPAAVRASRASCT